MEGIGPRLFFLKCRKLMQSYCYLISAVVVHLIFAISIFDIYFKSTVIHGMTPYSNPLPAPARRLVLFVVDGLRADTFKNLLDSKNNDMYLKFILANKGVGGTLHCKMPTESRTGHVALIAGMNEDNSAVFTGWQRNPVSFDSVFNESRFTWSWGSPDILPIFSEHAYRNHVFADSYDAHELDFASKNPSYGDMWVFEKFENFLKTSNTNITLSQMLSEDKIVFFLHLIATDSLGHGKKPASVEYRENIVNVDKQIRRTVDLIDSYFNHDARTAFVVTADHGMTDHGSHGSGSWEETEVPIVAWGAGIRGPNVGNKYDIQQVDATPLMAALIGIANPMNSIGVLPLKYFNVSDEFNANSLLTNALQLISLSDANQELKKKTALTLYFREFSGLTSNKKTQLLNVVQNLILSRKYDKAIEIITELINKVLDSIHYYETYDRTVLNVTISLGFLSWMAYLISYILEKYTNLWNISLNLRQTPQAVRIKYVFFPCIILAVMLTYLLKAREVGVQYYAYFFIPLMFFTAICRRLNIFKIAIKLTKEQSFKRDLFFKSIVTLFVLEVLVSLFFYRGILTLGLFCISLWPWFTPMRVRNKKLCVIWTTTVVSLSVFPLLPVVGTISNYNLVFASACLTLVAIIYCASRTELRPHFRITKFPDIRKKPDVLLLLSQIFLLCLSIFTKYRTIRSIEENQGLLLSNQIFAWTILSVSFFLPLFSKTKMLFRLFHIYVSAIPVYVLMSTSYEVLFILIFCLMCLLWVLCEHELSTSSNLKIQYINLAFSRCDSVLTFEDIRRACFFLFFIFTAFFGTGHVASLSGFDAVSVFCFLTVFRPVPMILLLVLKVLVPFILVACSFYFVITICHIQIWSLFSIVLVMSDFMSLQMFLMVQDSGSWLDIGSSISRYLLMITITLFSMFLYLFSRILMTKSFRSTNILKYRKS